MKPLIRKIFFSFSINFCFLIILILGIQNSGIKNKVKLLGNESVDLLPNTCLHIIVDNPYLCFAYTTNFFYPKRISRGKISQNSSIHKNASISNNIEVGNYVTIAENCLISKNVINIS